MEDQKLDSWQSTDFLASAAARLAVGLGCVAVQIPRPGMELLSADFQDAAFVRSDDALFGRPPGVTAINFADSSEDELSPVIQHIQSLVSNLSMPEAWRKEGVEEPSEDCIMYAGTILRRLFENYDLIPYKTSVSKDGGIFAAYRSPHNKNILRVEVDNELDAVAVVTDGAEILSSGLLEGDDTEHSIIRSLTRIMA
jgi:hypothetical protein